MYTTLHACDGTMGQVVVIYERYACASAVCRVYLNVPRKQKRKIKTKTTNVCEVGREGGEGGKMVQMRYE